MIFYITQLQCNTVHSKTLQLPKCNNWQSNHLNYLLNYDVSAFKNTSHIPQTQFDKFYLVWLQLNAQDIATHTWNGLPEDVILSVFRNILQTLLFRQS